MAKESGRLEGVTDKGRQTDPHKSAWTPQTADRLASAIEKQAEFFNRFRERTPAIFLDYDGTLTPIMADPEKAKLPNKTRKVLKRLAEHYSVAIISGRDLGDVQNMVGLDDIAYAGSHGFDIVGPGGRYQDQKMGERFLPALERAEGELRTALKDIPGAKIERKRFAITAHYRQVRRANVAILEQRFDAILSHHPKLRKSTGKKVFELRPNIDWDKGKALLYLLEVLYNDHGRVLPVYIGDDVTDEDAFRAISDRGIAIAVGRGKRPTVAHYLLRNPAEVAEFLQKLATVAERGVDKSLG